MKYPDNYEHNSTLAETCQPCCRKLQGCW